MKLEIKKTFLDYSSDITIIINSCDAYNDVLELFLKAFEEYWPDNIYPLIINTESSNLLSYNADQKLRKNWGERLIDILQKVNTPYVIMLFDDFILESTVDSSRINTAIHILEGDPDSSVFYLNFLCIENNIDDPDADYRLLSDNVDFRLNSAPAIWKKEDLVTFTKPIDNPWSWEVFGSYRTFNKNKNFYSTSSQTKNIFNFNDKKGGAIYRGKWVKDVVYGKDIKYKLNIDFEKRGFINYNEKINRSLKWKIDFIILGFRSIRLDMYKFFYRYFKSKLKKQSHGK